MIFDIYIAKRIVRKNKASFSNPLVKLGVVTLSLGLAVMLMSVFIVTGFQKSISDKVIGFGSHIKITAYNTENSFETDAISVEDSLAKNILKIKGVKHIQVFGYKAGILKNENNLEGLVLKGIGSDYDWGYFKEHIIEGDVFKVSDTIKSNDIVLSEQLCLKMNLKIGDKAVFYFIQDPPRLRKFIVKGIYKTGLEDFDKRFAFVDIAHIRKLNDWDSTQAGGYEILTDDFSQIENIAEAVKDVIPYNYTIKNIKEQYPEIFEWLEIININVVIILSLMLIVAGISIISTMLVLILERTQTVGILKALGTANISIRRIFIYCATYITLQGIIIGNIIAIGLALIQKYYGLIKLDQQSYYVSQIPINIDFGLVLLINLATFIICVLVLIIPSMIIARISPVKAIRFS